MWKWKSYPSRTSIFRPGNPSMKCIVHPYYILYRKGNVIMKRFRYTKIKEIVQSRPIETQEELAKALQEEGIEVTQATVSRDIKEYMLIKVPTSDGHYRYALSPEQKTRSCPRTAWPACSRTPSSASIRRITRSSSILCRVRPIPLPPPSTMPCHRHPGRRRHGPPHRQGHGNGSETGQTYRIADEGNEPLCCSPCTSTILL